MINKPIYIYIYIHIYMCVYIYIYIYTKYGVIVIEIPLYRHYVLFKLTSSVHNCELQPDGHQRAPSLEEPNSGICACHVCRFEHGSTRSSALSPFHAYRMHTYICTSKHPHIHPDICASIPPCIDASMHQHVHVSTHKYMER